MVTPEGGGGPHLSLDTRVCKYFLKIVIVGQDKFQVSASHEITWYFRVDLSDIII